MPNKALARAALMFLCAGRMVQAQKPPKIAAITVHTPDSLAHTYPGYFASFSPLDIPEGKLVAWAPVNDPMGCDSYTLPDKLPGGLAGVAVVRRGNCTFMRKATVAKLSGAEGMLVVSDTDTVQIMGDNDTHARSGVIAVAIPKSFGDKIIDWAVNHSAVTMSFEVYKPKPIDVSELLMICLGTSLVAAGAYFSTSDLSTRGTFQQAVAAPQEEIMEVDSWVAIGFFVFGSCFLVILYFFMHYLIYFIIFAFCLGGFNTLTQFGSIFLQWLAPSLKKELGFVTQADVLASVPALAMVISWFVLEVLQKSHHGWIFQDIIGAGFLCWLQRTLRMPNIRIATLFLCIMFVFDIFWVFISPLLFQGNSVMVTVATGGDTHLTVPMLLRLPAINDPFGNDRMLGFGDIALPGLLVSFLRRHDVQSRRGLFDGEGYFGPALVGYFFGLCATIVALTIMQKGQPALLYLVPGTLGTTVVRACWRKELTSLWDGRPCGAGAKIAGGGMHDVQEGTCCSGNDGL